MQDRQEHSSIAADSGEKQKVPQAKPQLKKRENISSKVFNLILKYRETAVFRWVNKNHVLSLVIVTMWGMLIVGAFLFIVIYSVINQGTAR